MHELVQGGLSPSSAKDSQLGIGNAMEHEIKRFLCIGDDGSTVAIVEHQHVDHRLIRGTQRAYPGARRFALATGEPVRVIDERTYEVVETGELLCRIDRRGFCGP